jgi:hypothetical protein
MVVRISNFVARFNVRGYHYHHSAQGGGRSRTCTQTFREHNTFDPDVPGWNDKSEMPPDKVHGKGFPLQGVTLPLRPDGR